MSMYAIPGHERDTNRVRSKRTKAGFSLVETVVTLAIIVTVASIAVIQIGPVVRTARVNTAAAYVLDEVRHTRERAIDERRRYRITFNSNAKSPFATMQVFQGNLNAAGALVYTPDSTLSLPFDMQFLAPVNPVPPAAPDGICSQANPIDFAEGTACGEFTTITLNPDGSITDPGPNNIPQGTGNLLNGVIYMGRPSDPLATRAVSFFGATGRTKGWRMIPTTGGTWAWSIQ